MQLKALYELCFPTVISSIFLLHPAHSLRSLLKKQANQMRWFTTSMTEQKAFPDKRSFFCWTKAKHKPRLRWQKERDGGVGHGTSRIEMLLLSLGFLQSRPEDAPGPAFMSGGEHLYWINLLFFLFFTSMCHQFTWSLRGIKWWCHIYDTQGHKALSTGDSCRLIPWVLPDN